MATENHDNDSVDVPPLPGDVPPKEPLEEESNFEGAEDAVGLREEEAEILRPKVERAILLSGRKDRTVLATALSSVFGAAMRRSVADFFRRIIISINRLFVLTFSVEGISWRFEAFRTGKPFKQVVDEHSLVCPVIQVFLIHRHTGLLIQQVHQDEAVGQDGDMVSGMLTAIQDFVHDSFQSGSSGDLEVISVGDLTVLLEQGPLAIMAGIVSQGFAPQSLRSTFRRALDQIHEDYYEHLVDFRGDVAELDRVRPILEACLKKRMVKGEDKMSPLTGVVLLVPFVILAVWAVFAIHQMIDWRQYLKMLAAEPGIVVVETGKQGSQRFVRGLRDPLADDPVGMLVDAGIDPLDVVSEWQFFQSLDDEMVFERVRRVLEPPVTVSIDFRNGVLTVEGEAEWQWIEDVPARLVGIQGVQRVRTEGVVPLNIDEQNAWVRYLDELLRTPGLLVLEKGRWNGAFYIAGMRDPLAPDPVAMQVEMGLPRERVRARWEVYQALHPSLVIQRARAILDPPVGVTLTLNGETLKAVGSSAHDWVSQATLLAKGLAGVSRFDVSELVDTDYEAFKKIVSEIEEQIFYFLANRIDLWPGQDRKFRQFVDNIRRFASVSRRLGSKYRIEIRGHGASTGDNEEVNVAASEAVAARFYSRLETQHLEMGLFEKRSMGGEPSELSTKDGARRREAHVSFHVIQDN